MRGDLAQADLKRTFLFFALFLDALEDFRLRGTNQFFERLRNLLVADCPVLHGHFAAFDAARGLHNDPVTLFEVAAVRVEIIYLPNVLKTYAYDFRHTGPPLYRPAAVLSRAQ